MMSFTIIIGILVNCCPVSIACEVRPRSIIGAIRWDAWHGDEGMDLGYEISSDNDGNKMTPGMVVEQTLAPKHWHYRLPFYARILGEDKVEVRGNSQEVMDKEILYASNAGLDYWAFLTYHPKSPMMSGLNLYLSRREKPKIKFCVIIHHIRTIAEEVPRIVEYMKNPRYVRVVGNRPLVYAFSCKAGPSFYDALLTAATASGLERPYLVNMGYCPKQVNFDALSSYTGRNGVGEWNTWKRMGYKAVPAVSAGWDPRPRIETPCPWAQHYKGSKATMKRGRIRTAEEATADIAGRVKAALEWNQSNPDAAEANAVIIYAWNEFDEGGWICPTLSEGTSRLDAISRTLKQADVATQQFSAGRLKAPPEE